MIKIRVFKNNILTNEASFENQQLADKWLNQQLLNKSFGESGTYQIKVIYG